MERFRQKFSFIHSLLLLVLGKKIMTITVGKIKFCQAIFCSHGKNRKSYSGNMYHFSNI